MESDNDSDVGDDILGDLLANDEEFQPEEASKKVIKELDFNFLDDIDESTKPVEQTSSDLPNNTCDSSDDEDNKYFQEQKYTDSGRGIKELLKKQEFDKQKASSESPRLKQLSLNSFISNKIGEKVENAFEKSPSTSEKVQNNSKEKEKKSGPLSEWLNRPPDVYSDPIFALRIVKPLISSTELKERMKDRTPVTVSKVKQFIKTQNLENDWVIAGVLIQRSTTRKSQNGNQYCIWTISDLTENVNTVSIFLFSGAYKLFWKTTEKTVVGILNPNVMESRNEKDQATLSVDNAQKIMILGDSRDMGRCKSVKKSGEPCTNIINTSKCEYCIYHVKQEYNKASRRSDLQTDKNNRRFANTFGAPTPKNFGSGMYNQGNHQNVLTVPAKRNYKMEQKDSERLAMLMGKTSLPEKTTKNNLAEEQQKKIACSVELTSQQVKKDLERLNKMRDWTLDPSSEAEKPKVPATIKPQSAIEQKKGLNNQPSLSVPRLGAGFSGGLIDFSAPITKKHINTAKLNAIKWAKEKGGLKQSNPNKIRESREKLEASVKRRREELEESDVPKPKKMSATSDKFKELMEATSAHTDLIEKSHEDEKEKYFNKLEAKERMEEKMMTTFKVETKAVKCLVCKYTAFSAADLCKEKRHPLRVIDAIKSFFKCSDCGNRTISLDRIPSQSCKKCSGSNWVRAAMMAEKRTNIPGATLSIRGGEEKFMGSDVQDANINLLVPDTEKNI